MPRWPAGLIPAAGALVPLGQAPLRPPATPMRHYWRRTVTELCAATPTVTVPAGGQVSANVGPQGVGEWWDVTHVQVYCSSQFNQPPLAVQIIQAQQVGLTTTQPPPIIAQVWAAAAQLRIHLLAQTAQGGNDEVGVSWRLIAPGERVRVIWYGAPAGDSAWAIVRGTRIAASAT